MRNYFLSCFCLKNSYSYSENKTNQCHIFRYAFWVYLRRGLTGSVSCREKQVFGYRHANCRLVIGKPIAFRSLFSAGDFRFCSCFQGAFQKPAFFQGCFSFSCVSQRTTELKLLQNLSYNLPLLETFCVIFVGRIVSTYRFVCLCPQGFSKPHKSKKIFSVATAHFSIYL